MKPCQICTAAEVGPEIRDVNSKQTNINIKHKLVAPDCQKHENKQTNKQTGLSTKDETIMTT